jgi:hypothetical protein
LKLDEVWSHEDETAMEHNNDRRASLPENLVRFRHARTPEHLAELGRHQCPWATPLGR